MFSRIYDRIATPLLMIAFLLVLSITPVTAFASPIFYAFPFATHDDTRTIVDIEYVQHHGVWLLDSEGNVSFYDGVHYHPLSEFISLPEGPISRMAAFDNALWLIVNHELFRFEIAANKLERQSLGEAPFITDIEVSQQALWVSTSSDLYQFTEGNREPLNLGRLPLLRLFDSKEGMIGLDASSLIDLSTNKSLYVLNEESVTVVYNNGHALWIGSDSGLARVVDGKVVSRYLDELRISAFIENKEGIWVGTTHGLYRGKRDNDDSLNFSLMESNVDDQFGLLGNKITDIATSNDDEMWISTELGLNYHSSRSKGIHRFSLSQQFPDWGDIDLSAFVSLRGEHYLSSRNKVLMFDAELNLLRLAKLSFTVEGMAALYDSLWIVSASGLAMFDPKTFDVHVDIVPESLKGLAFDKVIADSHSLWLVTEQRLFRFWPDSNTVIDFGSDWSTYRNTQLNTVLDLDARGSWLGSSDGLYFYFDGRFQKKLSRDDVGSIKSLSLGANDNLWLLTDRGVYQYAIDGDRPPQKAMSIGSVYSGKCLTLSEDFAYVITTKGIERLSLKSNQQHHIEAGYRSSASTMNQKYCEQVNGSLLVAGDYGVFSIPDYKLQAIFDTPLRTSTVGSISVNGKPWWLGATSLGQVSIPSQSSVMIDVGKMPFRQHEGIVYRLEGGNAENWHETKDQILQFSALESGTYTLMVSERTQGGHVKERALITLNVGSPWYQSLGTLLLATLLLSSISIAYYRHKAALVKSHNVQLRHTVHKKVIEIDRRESLANVASQSSDNENVVTIGHLPYLDVLPEGHFADYRPHIGVDAKESNEHAEKKEGQYLEKTQWQKDVLEAISLHFHDPDFSLAVMAKALFTSERSLQRRFKAEFGYTFKEVLISTRLANAQRMLYQGDKIANVAIACGFNEPSYFTKSFKAKYGYTPSQFRESCESRER